MILDCQPDTLRASAGTLVLSLFPGVGLLDMAFEQTGFSVVRGPDLIFGGDVRRFHAPAGHFSGIIGGPPCQRFSLGNRKRVVPGAVTDADLEMIRNYLRIVAEGQPEWWLMENVAGSPELGDLVPAGYRVQLFTLNSSQVGSEQNRLRKFHFGHRPGTRELIIPRTESQPGLSQRTCLASEGKRKGRRAWDEFCRLQGLPAGYDLPGFTVMEKYRAVGNGVPLELGRALAQAIVARDRTVTPQRVCECG